MRFGISATSWIFPKNLRTRLRPVNVWAIFLAPRRTVGTGTTLQRAAIHRDRQDRRRGTPHVSCDSARHRIGLLQPPPRRPRRPSRIIRNRVLSTPSLFAIPVAPRGGLRFDFLATPGPLASPGLRLHILEPGGSLREPGD